jgi:type III restriction enzyme
VLSFKLSVRIFDVFGEALDNGMAQDLFTASESDLDRQLRAADAKLGAYGFPNKYGQQYGSLEEPSEYKIDCILFAADDDCIAKLITYAEQKFHSLNDQYRKYVVNKDERCKKQYSDIVANGDVVSKHNFTLPETISAKVEEDGDGYYDHLFADDSGVAKIKLNSWEKGVIAEEEKASDFVCWLRNPSRGSWALCIPYELNGEIKPMYPDFIIVRRDSELHYVLDILEPHGSQFVDNLEKAKGLANYAEKETKIGRVQLIRQSKDAAGKVKFKRLDLSRGNIRGKILKVQTNEELDHIFDVEEFY